jgi:excisionase family DNA binding protein
MDDEILVVSEAALVLRTTNQRVYYLVRLKKIPFILLGDRQYRFSKKALMNWLENGGNRDDNNDK